MRWCRSTLLPIAILAVVARDAAAQYHHRGYRAPYVNNGMELSPFGPIQMNPGTTADYQAFVRNPLGYQAMMEQRQQQAMIKYQQQYQQALNKQMQEEQKAYQKWAKEHPTEAAAQEKAQREFMARMANPTANHPHRKHSSKLATSLTTAKKKAEAKKEKEKAAEAKKAEAKKAETDKTDAEQADGKKGEAKADGKKS